MRVITLPLTGRGHLILILFPCCGHIFIWMLVLSLHVLYLLQLHFATLTHFAAGLYLFFSKYKCNLIGVISRIPTLMYIICVGNDLN